MKEHETYRLNIRTDNQIFIDLLTEHQAHGYASKSGMVVDTVLKYYHLSDDDRIRNLVMEYLEKHAWEKIDEFLVSEKCKRWIEELVDELIDIKREMPFR